MSEKFDQGKQEYKKIQWIAVKNISVVWVESQRPLNERHAQSIADNFDPEMFGTLAVTKPNGKGIFHVIDGHHRKVAVEKMWGPNEMVPCQVFDAEDPKRAAELFDHINSKRRSPVPLELFKVRITAGEELQTAVDKIVRNCGYTVGFRSPTAISCVGSLENVYQSYGPAILQGTLTVIHSIWGPDSAAMGAHFIKGFGKFLSEFRALDHNHLRTTVAAKYTPARLEGAARSARELQGGKVSDAIRDLLVATYNRGLNKKKWLVQEPKR